MAAELARAPPLRLAADLYVPSPRAMPERLEDRWYDADHQVRRVGTRGEIKWRGEFAFVSEAVGGELVGLAEPENGDHVVRFCGRDLGLLDRCSVFRRFAPPRTGLRQRKTPHTKNCRPSARSRVSRISPVEHIRVAREVQRRFALAPQPASKHARS
jgi:hypothetical protein